MADSEKTENIDELATLAVTYSKVFPENEYDLLTNKPIADFDDLFSYYKTEMEGSEETIEEVKIGIQKLKDDYMKAALNMTVIDDKGGIIEYLNPITQEIKTINVGSTVQEAIEALINQAVENETVLPKLNSNDPDWLKKVQEFTDKIKKDEIPPQPTYSISDNMVDSGIATFNESQSIPTPPSNKVITTTNQNTSATKTVFIQKKGLRNQLIPKMSHSNRTFYIIQFRNYLRILRRLWIMTTLRKGLTKDVTYVTFVNEDHFQINQPFLKRMAPSKDISAEINKRLFKAMRFDHFHHLNKRKS